MLLKWLSLFICFGSVIHFAQADIIIDDFNDNVKTNWSGSSTYQMTEANGELQIVSTKTVWRVFQKNISVTDMSAHKVITLKVKIANGSTAPIIRLDLEDVNGFITNRFNNVFTPTADGNYATYSFDFNNKFHQLYSGAGTIVPKIVDSSKIIKLTFHFNPGVSYNGTVFFDDIIIPGAQDMKLVTLGSQWSYAKADTVSGNWTSSSYAIDTWPLDTALFGYGTGSEKTVIDFGNDPNNKPLVWYFRQTVNITDLAKMNNLILEGKVDDGAVVYVNGAEVFRYNLPAGSISNTTAATNVISGSDENIYSVIPASVLQLGDNVISVSIHQATADDVDMKMDIKITATYYTDGIIRGPYLQSATTTSMIVRWRTLQATTSRVKYGNISGSLTSQVDSTTLTREHEVKITGLTANSTYYYQIENTTGDVLKAEDPKLYFQTLTTDVEQPLQIWVTGDAGRITEYQRNMRDAYYQYTGTNHTDAWLLLGDNAYNDGTDEEYQYSMFENMFEEIMTHTVIWPAPGNHDLDKYDPAMKDAPYFDIFSVPTQGEAGGVASGTESYYSFNIGNVHFISLDSYDTPRDSLQAMGVWLKQDLEANTLPWIVAYWHHPPYSKGSHDSDDINDSKERNPSGRSRLFEMREQIVPLLEKYGVDLVLTGHSHCYERSYLINGHYSTSDEFYSHACIMNGKKSGKKNDNQAYVKNPTDASYPNIGTVYAVVGASGETSATTTAFNTYEVFYFSTIAQTGSMVLLVEKDTLTAKYIYADGTIADEFSIVKDPNQIMNKVLSVTNKPIVDTHVLKVMPNPVAKEMTAQVHLKNTQSVTMRIINMQGHEVLRVCTDKSLPAGESQLTANLDTLPVGTYVVTMEMNGKIYSTKLIKQ
ncbi:MAG: metallophosphoesterase [Cytophagaceae bacterium]